MITPDIGGGINSLAPSVLSAAGQAEYNVPILIIDGKHIDTGVPYKTFTNPRPDTTTDT